MPSLRRPEARSPKLGRLASVFPAILYDAGPGVISQRYWITGISGLNFVKATAKHRPAQRGTRWETYGAPETGAAHARQEAPVPRPPGGYGGRPPKRGTRLGGRRRHAAHAPAARRLTTSPGESASASPPPSPTPQGSPGVCLRQSGLLGRRTPGPVPSSPGGRARGFGRACPGRGGLIQVIQA